MKQRLLAILLSLMMIVLISGLIVGCGSNKESTEDMETKQSDYTTPDDVEPAYYTSEEELQEEMFYIVHTEKKKDKNGKETEVNYYYPVYNAEHTFEQVVTEPAGADPTRVMWVNYNIDEGLIPTFYPGDKLIFKSSTMIPTIYSMEKFFDDGYTFGVCGLQQDLSGNYKYSIDDGGFVMSTSDATGFDGLKAESIYFVSAGDDAITSKNVSLSGTITGLDLMHSYKCDIRTGTERVDATLTANIHAFSSAENYMFGSFTFITDHIAEINIPDYITTGYYNISGAGMFRYLKKEKSYKKLSEKDYNDTIYTYDENSGTPNGTESGLVIDENGFLVESTEETSDPDYGLSRWHEKR